MPIASIDGIKLSGIAASVPKNTESNRDYPFPTEKEKELFIKTVGIENRRVAPVGLTASDLCLAAANELISKLGVNKDEIKVLVFVSQTPDYLIPPTSTILQDKLNLPKDCIALDINLGCSGYVYGLFVASSLMRTMRARKGILLVGDVSTSCLSQEDKSTAPIFSDAGSATLLEMCEENKIYFNLQNDGSGFEAISIPDGGMRNPFKEESLEVKDIEKGIRRNATHLIMQGMDVFNFSLREVAPNIKALLSEVNEQIDNVDYFVLHQANKLMNDSIRKKLGIEPERLPLSLKNFGNTSSASIPITMVTELGDELRGKNLKLVLSGFGVGLSWGSVLVDIDKITCLPLLEV